MPFGLPARDEANWDTKLNDSINAIKATADAAQPSATLDASVTAVDANAASALRVQQDARLSATFVPTVQPAKYGAVGDGTTDDTTALQDALTAAAGGTLVVTDTHKLNGTLVPTTGQPVTIHLAPGAEIVQYANAPHVKHVGSYGAAVAVTAAPALGAVILTVNPATFAVGDLVLVESADAQANNTDTEGMYRRIIDLDATTITLDAPLYVALPTSPTVRKVNLASQVTFTGPGTWRQDTPATKTREMHLMVVADSPRWLGVDMRDGGGPAAQLYGCEGGEFSGTVDNLLNDPAGSHYGYGVNLSGPGRNFRVHTGHATRVRHGFTTGDETGHKDELGVGATYGGCPEAFHVASTFKVSDIPLDAGGGLSAGIDTHPQGFAGIIEANVEGCAMGVNDRSRSARIGGTVSGAFISWNPASEARNCFLDRPATRNVQRNEGAGTPYVIRNSAPGTIIDSPVVPTLPSGALGIVSVAGDHTLRGGGSVNGGAAGVATELFYAAPELGSLTGTPSNQPVGSLWSAWLLDAAAIEGIGVQVRIPAGWQTYDVIVQGANFTAGAGDVVLRAIYTSRAAGDNVGTGGGAPSAANVTTTAGAQNIQQDITLASGLAVAATGRTTLIRIDRMATDAADTLGADYAIGALILRKAS